MKYHFCTYFDSNYLMYGYTLFRSLKRTGIDFTLYVCCLDEPVYDHLLVLNHEEIIPIRLADIEFWDPAFAACKENRTRVEYYFTLSPVLPLYILAHYSGIDILAYLDSDLYFFSSPEKLYQVLGGKSLLIVKHDYYPAPHFYECVKISGKYNMAFQLYRNDAVGVACLRHWRQECLDWCHDYFEDGKFADQKYLEEWPEKFDAVVCPTDIGAGLAPWNCGMHQFDFAGADVPTVDGVPLIYYHYQGTKMVGRGMMLISTKPDIFYIGTEIHDRLYGKYYNELTTTVRYLRNFKNIAAESVYRFAREKKCSADTKSPWYKIWQRYLKKLPWLFSGLLAFHGKRYFAFTYPIEKAVYFASLKRLEKRQI